MNQHEATQEAPRQTPQVDEERYRPVLANQRASWTLRAIYQEVYQEDYPDEVQPFGFVTLSDLRACARFLGTYGVTTLADIGCGRGGPGLWVARELGASLTGVDIVEEAVAEAARLTTAFDRAPEAEFHVANATATGLPTQGFDGAMSIDALWMVLNKAAAFEELARLLRPGSPLVFTTWSPPHLDYAWFLEPVGFRDIETVEVTGSTERQLAVYERILTRRAAIAQEMGADAAQVLVDEATEAPELLGTVPRVMVRALRA